VILPKRYNKIFFRQEETKINIFFFVSHSQVGLFGLSDDINKTAKIPFTV